MIWDCTFDFRTKPPPPPPPPLVFCTKPPPPPPPPLDFCAEPPPPPLQKFCGILHKLIQNDFPVLFHSVSPSLVSLRECYDSIEWLENFHEIFFCVTYQYSPIG